MARSAWDTKTLYEQSRVPGEEFSPHCHPLGIFVSDDPKDLAWWTRWGYPGNPYKDSKPAKLRALVASAVDLMMQDQEHDDGKNRRSDYLGGGMIRFGYTYYAVKDALPLKWRFPGEVT